MVATINLTVIVTMSQLCKGPECVTKLAAAEIELLLSLPQVRLGWDFT
jgi:hypothetical protein